MRFRVLLHLLQVLIVAVFCKPGDDILARPVDLERVRVLIIYMVLCDVSQCAYRLTTQTNSHQSASDQHALFSRFQIQGHKHQMPHQER